MAVRSDVLLIENPAFRVHFPEVQNIENSIFTKIQNVSLAGFLYIKCFFSATYQSVKINVQYLPSSFKFCVLDPCRHTRRITKETLIFYLCFWAIVHVIGLIVMTIIYLIKEVKAQVRHLMEYAHRAINIHHIQTKEVSIDVSHVPEEIQVGQLLDMFDQINFTHPNRPGYIPHASLHGSNRNHLEDFVRRVQEREAFVGTPPALAYAQLMRFYEQIEKAVRFAIHKVTSDFDNFMQERGGRIPTREEEDAFRTYQALLENKARLAIDLTIAGEHCGARYMGEAMQVYFSAKGEEALQGTMKEVLETTLARRRKEIAETHIAVHLGQNTHDYSSYMANLGKLLGIPGTENVIEYLGGHFFNRDLMLRRFFEEYTPGCIRETIQAQYVTSQAFREMVFDWLKDQVGSWKEGQYQQTISQVQQQVSVRLQQEVVLEDSEAYQQIKFFQQFWDRLLEDGVITTTQDCRVFAAGIELPDIEQDWEGFISELFAIERAKEVFRELMDPQIEAQRPMDRRVKLMQKRRALVDTLHKDQFLPLVIGSMKQRASVGHFEFPEELSRRIILEEKTNVINAVLQDNDLFPIDSDVLRRAIQAGNLSEILKQQLQMPRRSEFLTALFAHQRANHQGVANQDIQPLDENLLNWLLLSHGVLQAV